MRRFEKYESDKLALEAEKRILSSGGGSWVDSYYGSLSANLGDLLYHDSSETPPGAVPPDLVRWCRLGSDEILNCTKPNLFPATDEKWSPIRTGRLANQWFLNGISLLSGSFVGRTILRSLIISTGEVRDQRGIYTVRFWKNGQWVYVHIDDRIPCDISGAPLFSRSTDPNEVWILVLEKAFAKLHGSYLNLENGQTEDALIDLCGGIVEVLDLNWQNFLDRVQVQPREDDNPIVAATIHADQPGDIPRRRRNDGLLTGFSYSVLQVFEFSDGLRLVKLRDNWGIGTWRGHWSRFDTVWTDPAHLQVKERVCPDDELLDTEFVIEWEDFQQTFTEILACHIVKSNPQRRDWNLCTLVGKFVPENIFCGSGGNPNDMFEWLQNPMIPVSIPKRSSIAVVLRQKHDPRLDDFYVLELDRGFKGETENDSYKGRLKEIEEDVKAHPDGSSHSNVYTSGMGVMICRVGPYQCGAKRISHLSKGKIVGSSGLMYRNARTVCCFADNVDSGEYCIIPSTFHSGVFGEFVLDVFFSEKEVTIAIDPNAAFVDSITDFGSAENLDEDNDIDGSQHNPLPKYKADLYPYRVNDTEGMGAKASRGTQHLLFQFCESFSTEQAISQSVL